MFIMRLNEDIEGVRFIELAGQPTDEELEAYLAFEAARIETSEAGGVVVVIQLEHVWTATQRKRMRSFELEYATKSRTKQLGLAMVVPNGLIRGAMTAYYWIAPPEYPTTTVPNAAAAYPFVLECLRDAQLPVPAEAEFERVATAQWPSCVVQPGAGMLPLTG